MPTVASIVAAAFIECKSAHPFPVAVPSRSGVEACEEAGSVSRDRMARQLGLELGGHPFLTLLASSLPIAVQLSSGSLTHRPG